MPPVVHPAGVSRGHTQPSPQRLLLWGPPVGSIRGFRFPPHAEYPLVWVTVLGLGGSHRDTWTAVSEGRGCGVRDKGHRAVPETQLPPGRRDAMELSLMVVFL